MSPAAPIRMPSRNRKYGVWRACEYVSPLDLYGKPVAELTIEQENELIGYGMLRRQEDAG